MYVCVYVYNTATRARILHIVYISADKYDARSRIRRTSYVVHWYQMQVSASYNARAVTGNSVAER